MAHFRISDDIYDHPQFVGLSHVAFRSWVSVGAWCQRHLTDGVIPSRIALMLPHVTAKALSELVGAGLLTCGEGQSEDTFTLIGYLKHNDSRATVQLRRDKVAARKAKWLAAREREMERVPARVPNADRNTAPHLTSPHLTSVDTKYVSTNTPPTPPEGGVGAGVSDEHAERAGRFLERYAELFARHRNGAFYPLNPVRDYHYATKLVEAYPDAWLDKLATVYLLRDDREVSGKTRTVGQFLSAAPWCDAELRRNGYTPEAA